MSTSIKDDSIDASEVREIAALARLALSEAEVARLSRDIAALLDYVAKLDALDVEDVPPSAHGVELPTKLREDTPEPGWPESKVFANAPERIGDGFGVPKIIDES